MKNIIIFLISLMFSGQTLALEPIVTDSRIKTFIYNENDVFNIFTHYGYQSNIEFAKGEKIETISVGDQISWQIVPAGRRLFVRPLEERAQTNMTIITNKRAYQFDLKSSRKGTLVPTEDLSYVVRFFYPEKKTNKRINILRKQKLNFNYVISGNKEISPLKIFNDYKSTYFLLANNGKTPEIMALLDNGKIIRLKAKILKNSYIVVSIIAKQFMLNYGNKKSIIVNQNYDR